jgi:hypothetical protein
MLWTAPREHASAIKAGIANRVSSFRFFAVLTIPHNLLVLADEVIE